MSKNLTKIIIGDYIDVLTDYHSNGSYKALKSNVTLKEDEDYAVMIRTLNFEQNDFSKKLIYVDEHAYNHLEKSKVYKDDIIMNKIANPGSIYRMPYMEKPVSLGMNLFLIRFKETLNQKYMYYNMLNVENYIKSKANGTTTKTITKDSVKALELYVHEKKEQDLIANFLDRINAKIHLNNKINKELEEMAKTIYDYWFIQFDFPDKAGKPYKSSGGKMVWNEEIKREIPEGWNVGFLNDYITVSKGISYKSSDIENNTGTPMINLKSFNLTGIYKPEGIKYFEGTIKEDKILYPYDLVLACTDLTRNADIIGRSFLIPDIGINKYVGSCDIASVEIKENVFSKYYLNILFNHPKYHKYIKGFANGTNVIHLDIDGVKNYKTEVPSKPILEKLDNIIRPLEEKKSIILRENQELANLRDFLLPMLMIGQITFKEAKELVDKKVI